MEDYTSYFEPILDGDEQIIEIFKPNKKKLYLSVWLLVGIITLFMTVFPFVMIFTTAEPWFALIPLLILLIILFLTAIMLPAYYNNIFYAYTDRRLITRTGIIGIDFRFLIMDNVGAVNVYVSALDKMVGNTGSLIFGSTSTPLMQTENGSGSGYRFSHIEAPYELYKKIRVLIQKQRNDNNQQV